MCNMTDFVFLWQLNQKFMRWMPEDFYYKHLETLDVLRMVRIFSNEAADIELRNRLSKHPRNNGRDNTVHEELADTLMLALTVLPPPEEWVSQLCDDDDVSMDSICDMANQAVVLFAAGSSVWFLWPADLVAVIARYPGMAVEFELCKCWHRLAWKHASKAMDSYPEGLKIWQ